jgi:hypothetical protein
MQGKNIAILVLSLICASGCVPHGENTYELIISQSYFNNYSNGEKLDEHDTKISLIAAEHDKNRILQQVYFDNMRFDDTGVYIAGKNILKDGWRKHKNSLKEPHDRFVLKMDFNRFAYRDHDVDLAKGDSRMFFPNRLNPLRMSDSISLNWLMDHSIILVESDYGAKIGDGIRIPHASRLIRSAYSDCHSKRVKHTIVYDRNRQMIVASERRDAYTNRLLSKYELVKVIELTRDEFYEFWTGENGSDGNKSTK